MNVHHVLLAVLIFAIASAARAEDRISIVGSPQVLNFAEFVAKNFALHFEYPTPSLEPSSTGAGFGRFCAGVGHQHPDINGASRKISITELTACRENGVTEITEIMIGLDAIVIVSKAGLDPNNFTQAQLFAALARNVEKNGKIVRNEAQTWSDIDPSLRSTRIEVMGPSPMSATYYGFLKTIMDAGCASFTNVVSLDENRRLETCRSLRTDGAFQEGPKLENATIEWLQGRPSAYAIVSYPTLQRNLELLTINTVEGIEPTTETISAGKYPLVRPMYIYVKNQHITSVAGLQKLLYEFTSERAIGPEGYLDGQGLVPQSDIGRNRARDMALSLKPVATTTR